MMTTLKGKLGMLVGGVGALALLGLGLHQTARAQDQSPPAKVTPWAAMNTANEQVHGKPISANYELDEGHWLYDVMIVKDKTLHVVEVDANTGKANKAETSTPEEEAKETLTDLSKAVGIPASSATLKAKGPNEKGEKPD